MKRIEPLAFSLAAVFGVCLAIASLLTRSDAQVSGTTAPSITARYLYANSGQNLFALKQFATAGTTIVVGPGTYTTGVSNLLKDRVNWQFLPGSELEFVDAPGLYPTATHGCGIFDDRAQCAGGAVTSAITGHLTFRYSPGTNVWIDPTDFFYGYNTNSRGAIVVTNARSLIKLDAQIDAKVFSIGASTKVLYVDDCQTNSTFGKFNRASFWFPPAGFYSGSTPTIRLVEDHLMAGPLDASANAGFLRWNEGTMYCTAGDIDVPYDYVLDCYNAKTNSTTLWFTADHVRGKAYIVGRTNTWKVWAQVKEWENPSDNASAVNCYGAGSHYFAGQKISTKLGPVFQLEQPNTPLGDSNLTLWVNFDKVSGSNGWAKVTHGRLRGRVGQFEWNGPPPTAGGVAGLDVTNVSGMISLSGENMASPHICVFHGGGKLELANYLIHSTNRDPVFIAATNAAFNSCVFLPGRGATNSLRAGSAITAQFLGTCHARSNTLNVSAIVGTLNVDADVEP